MLASHRMVSLLVLAVAGAGGVVGISWCASGVVGYHVWRRTVHGNGPATDLSQRNTTLVSTTQFVDVLPAPGLTYEYQVVGVGLDGRLWPAAWVRHAAGSW